MARDSTKLEEKLGSTLATLADKLASVKGGRLLLALASGALSNVPVAGALGSAVVEYKNLYAAAATDEQISTLNDRVEEIGRRLADHTDQLDLLFKMIFGLSELLAHYLGEAAVSKLDDLDLVADSLLRPQPRYALTGKASTDQLQMLMDERQWEPLLALLDEDLQVSAQRSRLFRTRALYGLGRFDGVYVLLRKESLHTLSQEELECFIWASFEIGYVADAVQALSHHQKMYSSPSANVFRLSVRNRFGSGSTNQESEKGVRHE